MASVRASAMNTFLLLDDCVVYDRLSMGVTVGLSILSFSYFELINTT